MSENQTFQERFQRGKTLLEANDPKEAARVFIPLLEEAPGDLTLRQYLTQAYTAFRYYEEAVEIFRPNFEKLPETPQKYSYFGDLCFKAGLAEEALEHLGAAEKMLPPNAEIYSLQARCYVQLGDIEAAKVKITEALTLNPDHIPTLVLLSDVDPQALSSDNLARMTSVVEDKNEPSGERSEAAFALGKAYLKSKKYDQSFQFFQAGNTLLETAYKAFGVGYDQEMENRQYQDITSFYTKQLMERVSVGDTPSFTPVFIIGLPRSGTTLVEQILSSHSKVHGGGEFKLLGEFFLRLEAIEQETRGFPKELLLNQVCQEWGREYFQKIGLPKKQDITHTTDKMPLNFPYVGLAVKIFSNARFILLRRDPRDTCLSIYFQPLTDSYPASTSLECLGQYYQLFDRYLRYWASVLPKENVLEVSYENLVSDQESVSKNLIAFSGLKWETACLDFHKNPRSVKTMSNIQVRKPMTGESVGRWKNFEKHLGPLRDNLRRKGKNE